MNGTRALIDIAVGARHSSARYMAVSELCGRKAYDALEYVAAKSEFKDTRRYVTLCLYQMKAFKALRRLLEHGPKDVREHAKVLLGDADDIG